MKSIYRGLPAAALAIGLSACAASPESIKAAYVNPRPFAYLTCPQLIEYKSTLTAAYDKAANTEDNARMVDAATVILVGVPVGSATHESLPWTISDLKGRIAAVEQLQKGDNCGQRQASIDK
ncbi:MAG: hypothetical protein ACREHF_04840 [Rhizomicrobium sp.]